MKIFKFLLVTVTSFLFFFSQSALAVFGVEDVDDDKGEKTTSYGTEVEVNEFVLLDAMPDMELYYYPYSANDADADNSEDVPGGAGSVFVGGGVIKWHTNVPTTISIDDFTLINVDSSVTSRNDITISSGVGIGIGSIEAFTSEAIAELTFDRAYGSAVADMSDDMKDAYNGREIDNSSVNFGDQGGYTDFAAKFYIAVILANNGSVQGAGRYTATATVRALPTVS